MLRSKVGLVITVLGLCLPALAGAANQGPLTEPVSGSFSGSPVNVKQRVCQGQDGPYLELRGQFAGTIASSDPRLTGALEFVANPALVNLATGLGTFQGRFQILEAATGRQSAQGEFLTVVTGGGLNHGFAFGNVANQGAGAAANFFARFESILDASLNVTGTFGGVGDPTTPAVIQSGHCDGPFTSIP
jgi:hypothetical protein